MFSGYMTVNIIYSWRHKRAQEHTIINVMNVHVLYCDLMDFPYMDIFMRNVFYFKKVSPRSTQPADGHISLF